MGQFPSEWVGQFPLELVDQFRRITWVNFVGISIPDELNTDKYTVGDFYTEQNPSLRNV